MTPQGLTFRGISRSLRVPPCSLSLDDLKKLFGELNEQTLRAAERQYSLIQRPPETQEPEFTRLKSEAIAASGLSLVIIGTAGEQIVVTAPEAIEPSILPDGISSINFDSALSFNARMNYEPQNRFRLRLDFTEPPGFDAYNPWDQPTPNNSAFEITGTDDTWVAGVHQKVMEFLNRRRLRRNWLHTAMTFNLANWFIGFPAAFWAVFRMDSAFRDELMRWPTALRGALLIYLFLVALLFFRIFVGGLRWLFPLVELRGSRSIKARAAVGAVLVSIATAFLYDVLKAVANWIR
jgi:hypothetical protein